MLDKSQCLADISGTVDVCSVELREKEASMSKAKLLFLVIGLVAAGAVVFTGANRLAAMSSTGSDLKTAACESGAHSKTTSSCPASARAKTAGVAEKCPIASSCAGAGAGKSCSVSSSMSCGGKASKTASIETVPYREGKRVVLAGHYVCGHCELGVSDGCQPGFQTKDGKNYLLIKNNLSSELRSSARDKDVEIVTRVRKLNGVKYLEVEVIRNVS
jgi:hypothetical protein